MQAFKRLTLALGAILILLVASAVGAPHLFFMAGLLVALAGISYLLGLLSQRGLTFRREMPAMAWEGEEGILVYSVTNPTRLFRFFLMIREPFPEWIEMLEVEPPLFNVAGMDTTRVGISVRFRKRGVYRVEWFDVTALDPLGVFAFTRRVPCEGEIVVYPMPQAMGSMPLSGQERNGWQEFSAAALRGNSVDPDGVRNYVPGDPLRRIHWRQTARTGSLSVIEFEEPQAVNLVIALDLLRGTEVGQGTETTLEYAVRLAATIAQQATEQGASVRLLLPSPKDTRDANALANTFGRGEEHLYRLLDSLARVEADTVMPLSEVLTSSLQVLPAGTTLIAMTASPEPGLVEALSRFTVNGGSVALIYVDPVSFGAKDGKSMEAAQAVLADLLTVNVQTFVLRSNAFGDVLPEVAYVRTNN